MDTNSSPACGGGGILGGYVKKIANRGLYFFGFVSRVATYWVAYLIICFPRKGKITMSTTVFQARVSFQPKVKTSVNGEYVLLNASKKTGQNSRGSASV